MKEDTVRFKNKSQVTIPHEIVKALNLKEGDNLQCRLEDGKIVFVPMVSVPKDQAWFWTEEWQKEEREVEHQIRKGQLSAPMSLEDTLAELDSLSKE